MLTIQNFVDCGECSKTYGKNLSFIDFFNFSHMQQDSNKTGEIDDKQDDVISQYNQPMEYLLAAADVESPLPLTYQTFDWETATEKEKNA